MHTRIVSYLTGIILSVSQCWFEKKRALMWRDDYISIAENEEQKVLKCNCSWKNDYFFFFSLCYKLVSKFFGCSNVLLYWILFCVKMTWKERLRFWWEQVPNPLVNTIPTIKYVQTERYIYVMAMLVVILWQWGKKFKMFSMCNTFSRTTLNLIRRN